MASDAVRQLRSNCQTWLGLPNVEDSNVEFLRPSRRSEIEVQVPPWAVFIQGIEIGALPSDRPTVYIWIKIRD